MGFYFDRLEPKHLTCCLLLFVIKQIHTVIIDKKLKFEIVYFPSEIA